MSYWGVGDVDTELKCKSHSCRLKKGKKKISVCERLEHKYLLTYTYTIPWKYATVCQSRAVIHRVLPASGPLHGPLTRCVKLRLAHAPRMPGTFSPTPTSKETDITIPAITARAWHTCRDAYRDHLPSVAGKTFPAFPAHAQHAILRIWRGIW